MYSTLSLSYAPTQDKEKYRRREERRKEEEKNKEKSKG
jgi:hypothetical protein